MLFPGKSRRGGEHRRQPQRHREPVHGRWTRQGATPLRKSSVCSRSSDLWARNANELTLSSCLVFEADQGNAAGDDGVKPAVARNHCLPGWTT